MRRNARRIMKNSSLWNDKKIIVSGAIVLAISLLIVIVTIYCKNSLANQEDNEVQPSQIISLTPEEKISDSTKSASSPIGNTINESENANSIVANETSSATTNTSIANEKATNSAKETAEKITKNKTKIDENNEKNATTVTNAETTENIKFEWPIKGEILKVFSVDNLLFSNTLQEWTVHNGIDIKADKASIVCASADGVVKSKKNDPRYGLTVVLEHNNGYKTVYSNLLTAEFIVEGEKIKCGQSIGTVGNTANFEIADDFHLHFEILKDDEYVDPMNFLR